MQAKVLEFWSPAPLPEGDPGKNVMPPTELRKLEGEELEVSSYSSVGNELEVEITGASGPTPAGGAPKKRRRAIRKILISRIGAGATPGRTTRRTMPRPGSEDWEAEAAEKAASLVGGKEAAQGLSQLQGEETPLRSGRSLESAVLLKPSFNVRKSGG